MFSLRVSIPWLIIVVSGVICVNSELEEYFKWKQITFASVQGGKCFSVMEYESFFPNIF